MGKGYYSFSFSSVDCVSTIWEKGSIALKPGTLRLMRWVPNFSPATQRNTNAQVWVKFWDLGLEFWEPTTLFEIASGIGVPVKIDENTLHQRFGHYARVLVDIDLSSDPPSELVIKRACGEAYVISVEYERLPDICSHCGNVGHRVTACRFVRTSVHDKPEAEVVQDRGRSRKRSHKHKRRTKQVSVPKNVGEGSRRDAGKAVIVDDTPPAKEDAREGPSFVRQTPSPSLVNVVAGSDKVEVQNKVVMEGPTAPIVYTCAPDVEKATCQAVEHTVIPIVEQAIVQNVLVAEDVSDHQVLATQAIDNDSDTRIVHSGSDIESDGSNLESSVPIENWYDETEHVSETQEFTEVVSKARRRSMRKAANIESRQAYISRSKGASQ
ncbi:uncharacterized protein LOC133716837 [Rosa rugosa]|uniref:uncharacterized protein LOC133716837 n=1 Tax=Rosa rugosa TaxID=74645 RepID=UPI002B406332|nr:uncharacterized protein LOC133716837 [Rosa rugosa]